MLMQRAPWRCCQSGLPMAGTFWPCYSERIFLSLCYNEEGAAALCCVHPQTKPSPNHFLSIKGRELLVHFAWIPLTFPLQDYVLWLGIGEFYSCRRHPECHVSLTFSCRGWYQGHSGGDILASRGLTAVSWKPVVGPGGAWFPGLGGGGSAGSMPTF